MKPEEIFTPAFYAWCSIGGFVIVTAICLFLAWRNRNPKP
jgi:hypothetical protein